MKNLSLRTVLIFPYVTLVIILAIAIILITHLAARVGRALLKEKILDKRSLERGLKDSILTITSYLAWGLGLILALGILGVNTTSLAVIVKSKASNDAPT